MERKARRKDKNATGQARQPQAADTNQQNQLQGRRDFLKKTAVAGATFVAAMYVAPRIDTLLGPHVAHAHGSPGRTSSS